MSLPIALVVILVALSISTSACLESVTNNATTTEPPSPLEGVMSSFRSISSQLTGSDQQWLTRLSDSLAGNRGNLQEPLRLFANLVPKISKEQAKAEQVVQPTTSTEQPSTTTSASQKQQDQMDKNIHDLSAMISSSARLLETPMRVVSGMVKGANLTRAIKAADTLVKVVNTAKVSGGGGDVGGEGGGGGNHIKSQSATGELEHAVDRHNSRHTDLRYPPPEEDWKYYEYAAIYEPYAYRQPKYFSKECQFRFACEVGKIVKPVTYSAAKKIETSRFVQDIQNRYTRAMTYGTLRGNCERYYCVLVTMLGGPMGFASGVAEIVNRAVNSDMYESRIISSRSKRKWAPPGCVPCQVILMFLNPILEYQPENKPKSVLGFGRRRDDWFEDSYE